MHRGLGDPFNVGASDSTGALDLAYPAVYQATHPTFHYTIQNQTNLTDSGQITMTYAMFWSSPTDPGFFYYLDSSNPDGSGGKFAPVTNLSAAAYCRLTR